MEVPSYPKLRKLPTLSTNFEIDPSYKVNHDLSTLL